MGMRSASEAIAEARAELTLPRDRFAEVIGVSLEHLDRAERGDVKARGAALRGAAEVFGVEVSELLSDGVAGRASTTMLRSFIDHARDTAFVEVVQRGVHRELGSFVRHLRRKAWLRDALGKPQPSRLSELRVEARPIAEGSRPPHDADRLAVDLRTRLGLGDDPIPSMLALVRDRLGVEVHFTQTLWRRIDGASVSTGPVRGILVNLAGDGLRWWRTRTTLAHELCHLLFDGGAFAGAGGGPLLIFSPAARRSEPTEEGYEPRFGQGHTSFLQIEQRANAFAAYLLAPPAGVRGLFVTGEPARTWETVSRVAGHFGLSPLTAINVLKNVYRWSDQDRYALIDDIDAEGLELSRDHPDVVAAIPETPICARWRTPPSTQGSCLHRRATAGSGWRQRRRRPREPPGRAAGRARPGRRGDPGRRTSGSHRPRSPGRHRAAVLACSPWSPRCPSISPPRPRSSTRSRLKTPRTCAPSSRSARRTRRRTPGSSIASSLSPGCTATTWRGSLPTSALDATRCSSRADAPAVHGALQGAPVALSRARLPV
jgi:transcriptional regulator with XRE-family HTH domain